MNAEELKESACFSKVFRAKSTDKKYAIAFERLHTDRKLKFLALVIFQDRNQEKGL
jgi:hypothetical protein